MLLQGPGGDQGPAKVGPGTKTGPTGPGPGPNRDRPAKNKTLVNTHKLKTSLIPNFDGTGTGKIWTLQAPGGDVIRLALCEDLLHCTSDGRYCTELLTFCKKLVMFLTNIAISHFK